MDVNKKRCNNCSFSSVNSNEHLNEKHTDQIIRLLFSKTEPIKLAVMTTKEYNIEKFTLKLIVLTEIRPDKQISITQATQSEPDVCQADIKLLHHMYDLNSM